MDADRLVVAAPWTLSHYIPLNGLHSLYRALFDYPTKGIELRCWDNVKLQCALLENDEFLAGILTKSFAEQRRRKKSSAGDEVAKAYEDFFWSPNRVLTEMLPGDLEFHHTALYPSMSRPYVFHCESFAPIFMPFLQQGSGSLRDMADVRKHYRAMLESPLCLGIYSHVPETLQNLETFFGSAEVSQKLKLCPIGLSPSPIIDAERDKAAELEAPVFLFTNSANQNQDGFFKRGGHLVLRFWERMLEESPAARLVMRCRAPSEEVLRDHGVDLNFVARESGRSIVWCQDYLTAQEYESLIERAHFFLLPSLSLHSVSIMQAMALGAIPVVTDTVGTDQYVEHGLNGVVLQGVREQIWRRDEASGLLLDHYSRSPELDSSLVEQMLSQVSRLVTSPQAFEPLSRGARERSRTDFSGRGFAESFWGSVGASYQDFAASDRSAFRGASSIAKSCGTQPTGECLMGPRELEDAFASVTQPMIRMRTGGCTVFELGGAYVGVKANPEMAMHDWSVLGAFVNSRAPEVSYKRDLGELADLFFADTSVNDTLEKMVDRISRLLKPFPRLHRLAAAVLEAALPYLAFSARYVEYLRYRYFGRRIEVDEALVFQGFGGYNITRFFHRYYALPQSAGKFDASAVLAGNVPSVLSSVSLDRLYDRVVETNVLNSEDGSTGLTPRLVKEGYHGYNIIAHERRFYAILQTEGEFGESTLQGLSPEDRLSSGRIAALKLKILQKLITGRVVGRIRRLW